MKKILAALACAAVIAGSAFSASAAISPIAAPEKPSEDNPVSPKTGYSVMAEVGAIAAVVSCSAAGIVLLKKDK